MDTEKNSQEEKHYEFLPDVDLDNVSLDDIDSMLSEEDERILMEIETLQQSIGSKPTFMKDLLDAVKKGTMDYLDAMTDTGDSFNDMKNPKKVRDLEFVEIRKSNLPADAGTEANWKSRTLKEAGKTPVDANASYNTDGMSAAGKALFERHCKAYAQRTKSVTAISTDGSTIQYKTNPKENYESLAGLRAFRIGRVDTALPNVEEMKTRYAAAVEAGTNDSFTATRFVMTENFKEFDNFLMKEYGFKTASEAAEWRKSNHFTIHEGPEGMYLVPTDVHDVVKHLGYRSKMTAALKGEEGAEEDFEQFNKEATKAYVKHELNTRTTRVAKGIGLSVIKDLLKHTIIIASEETYLEFKHESDESLIDRVKRILKKCWESIKAKVKKILGNLWKNIQGSVLNELLIMLNDYLLGTFKNIFKVIRQMYGSIKSAFKIITSKDSTWGDRLFEASKVLTAGMVGVLGFSLNELIEKGLSSIGFPFSSFVAECLSGLFAGIMSAVVLMLFDHIKANMKVKDQELQLALLNSKAIDINMARITLSSVKTAQDLADTYRFFFFTFQDVVKKRNSIIANQQSMKETVEHIQQQLKGNSDKDDSSSNELSDEQF